VSNYSLNAPRMDAEGVVSVDVYCLGKILEQQGVGHNFTETIISEGEVVSNPNPSRGIY